MIKVYKCGVDFYNENKDFLLTNKYTEPFFRLDSPLLTETNKCEFAIKAYNNDNNKQLLILKKEPYDSLYFGDNELVDELIHYLLDNNYLLTDYLCPLDLGIELSKCFNELGYKYKLHIAMDFLESREKYPIKSNNSIVEIPTLEDVDEIYDLRIRFVNDCGLKVNFDKEKIINKINDYRIIRKDNRIVSMAAISKWMEECTKIIDVYTLDEYRGKGYAKIICASILNEIIDSGKYAALNVDKKNPISYHLYTSIGFKKIFSQAIFKKE